MNCLWQKVISNIVGSKANRVKVRSMKEVNFSKPSYFVIEVC